MARNTSAGGDGRSVVPLSLALLVFNVLGGGEPTRASRARSRRPGPARPSRERPEDPDGPGSVGTRPGVLVADTVETGRAGERFTWPRRAGNSQSGTLDVGSARISASVDFRNAASTVARASSSRRWSRARGSTRGLQAERALLHPPDRLDGVDHFQDRQLGGRLDQRHPAADPPLRRWTARPPSPSLDLKDLREVRLRHVRVVPTPPGPSSVAAGAPASPGGNPRPQRVLRTVLGEIIAGTSPGQSDVRPGEALDGDVVPDRTPRDFADPSWGMWGWGDRDHGGLVQGVEHLDLLVRRAANLPGRPSVSALRVALGERPLTVKATAEDRQDKRPHRPTPPTAW